MKTVWPALAVAALVAVGYSLAQSPPAPSASEATSTNEAASAPASAPAPLAAAEPASASASMPAAVLAAFSTQPAGDAQTWSAFGASDAATRFSPAAQITPANVGQLVKLWEFHTGDLPPADNKAIQYAFQDTPQKIGDSLYVCTPSQILIALDPATGAEKWRHDPHVDRQAMANVYHAACRGVAYYEVPASNAPADCPRRILYGTSDARLLAVDASTGASCESFGTHGSVDLNAHMGNSVPGFVAMNSAPIVVRGVVVVGHQVRDGQRDDAPSGVVRGYDAATGAFRWAWDMGRPGITSEPQGDEIYTKGTPNVWTNLSADESLGLVYLPTGNSAADYFGGNRKPYEERYGSSIVAVDVDTGLPRWSFQTVHHDLWDYDLGSQATLVDFPSGGTTTPALVVPSKHGQIYVLDRATGQPLLPVTETPVPQGAAAGDFTAPTQPISPSMPDIIGPNLTEKDAWGITPIDQLICRIQFMRARYEGRYTPPSLQGSIVYPGYNGGVDWGGVAVDPERQILVVNNNRIANFDQLLTREQVDAKGIKALGEPGASPNTQTGGEAQLGVPYGDNAGPWMSPLYVPCMAPPWGYLGAIDLKTRKFLWRRPLGTGYDSGPLGIRSHLKVTMGTPNNGGSLVTRGGLVFIAAALDQFIRAFDTQSGELKWEARLPAGGQAGPMSYQVGSRQIVVIAAGGHTFMKTKIGDSVVAYGLPVSR